MLKTDSAENRFCFKPGALLIPLRSLRALREIKVSRKGAKGAKKSFFIKKSLRPGLKTDASLRENYLEKIYITVNSFKLQLNLYLIYNDLL